MKRVPFFCIAILLLFFGTGEILSAQARKQLGYDWQPSQVSATYQFTLDDYSFQSESGSVQRTRLNGGGLEYASRKLYPWEAVVSAQYSGGQPLGQHLLTLEGGAGYCRGYKRWVPFGRVLAGTARTSSNDDMYLYKGAKWGFAVGTSAGVDFKLTPHFGVRAFQLQNQYLPFGSQGSVYWSFSSGITYHFHS